MLIGYGGSDTVTSTYAWSFGTGSHFGVLLRERTFASVSRKDFWLNFSTAKRFAELANSFDDGEPLAVSANGHLPQLYYQALKSSGVAEVIAEGPQTRLAKRVEIGRLLTENLDIANYSRRYLPDDHGKCLFDRINLAGKASLMHIPPLSCLMSAVSSRCPFLSTCDNSDKKTCANSLWRYLDSLLTRIDIAFATGAYVPIHYSSIGSGSRCWSKTGELRCESKFELALVLMERELYGACFLPRLFRETGEFYSLI